MSALLGDNVVDPSENMAWFDGAPLMAHLETVDVEAGLDLDRFRLPVQIVTRPNLDFRGFAGTVASGIVRPGDEVRVACRRASVPRSSASSPTTAISISQARARGHGHARRRDRRQPRRPARRCGRPPQSRPRHRRHGRLDVRGRDGARPPVPLADDERHEQRVGHRDPSSCRHQHPRRARGGHRWR